MAHFEHPSSAITNTILVATSADPLARGTSASWAHPIRMLTVDDPQQYQVALVGIDFQHPGGGPVHVSTNLVSLSRYGSQMTNAIYRIGEHAAGPLSVQQTGSIVLWYPYATIESVTEVEVSLTDSAGALIPASGTPTTVTFAIRRV